MTEPGIVIVGAGECGMSLAVALIEAGHSGPIHLIGEETGHPYERPPLSKAHLEPGETAPPLALIGAQLLEMNPQVIHHQGVTATAIDRAAHELALSNGTRLAYGKLVLTTGATPRRLPMAMGLAGIHYLRAQGDATALRQALAQGGPVAIIGVTPASWGRGPRGRMQTGTRTPGPRGDWGRGGPTPRFPLPCRRCTRIMVSPSSSPRRLPDCATTERM